MKLESFFGKFEQISDSPKAVQKIRELVLELAVQGKLVEQIPSEGNGHELLRQIRKNKPLSPGETDEEPVDTELENLPRNWAVSKLGEVTEIIRGVSFPGSAKSGTPSKGDVACLRTASVQAEIDWDDLIYISPAHVSRTDQWIMSNDIMISMANSYALVGKVAIVRHVKQKATFGAFLAAIRPVLIEPYFLLYALRSPRMQAAFRASSSQTTNIANISLGRMRPLPFPLPPLAEQKRIVAKVDELMALCDRLEAQLKERDVKQAALAKAALAKFTEDPTPENLQLLFHPSFSIEPEDLRKTIVTLAVQGKIPGLNHDKDSAQDIVRRIEQLRSGEPHPEISQSEQPWTIPGTWKWVRLERVMDIKHGYAFSSESFTSKPSNYILTTPGNFYEDGGFRHRGEKTKFFKGEVPPSFILQAGDLIIPMTEQAAGLLGSPAFIPEDGKKYLHNQRLGKLELFSQEIVPDYVFWFFNSTFLRSELARTCTGMKVRHTSPKRILSVPFPLPPTSEQRFIALQVEVLMKLIDQLEAQLDASRTTGEKLLEAMVAELTSA